MDRFRIAGSVNEITLGIAETADASSGTRDFCLSYGMAQCVAKLVRAFRLQEALTQALDEAVLATIES
ncbi:MAG: hypothetical protein MK080_07995 [Opitutales bacterium]|nr:hypothetical protein [Opitutales bacterium]NRA27230.1 hypothetical protein [Opitutales bacterium]